MTIHVDAVVLILAAVFTVTGLLVWLVISTTGAEARAWDQAGRDALAAYYAPPPVRPANPPRRDVTVIVIPEGTSPSAVQRRIAAAIERGNA